MIDQKTLNSWYTHKSNKEAWMEDQEIKELEQDDYNRIMKEEEESESRGDFEDRDN